MGIPSGWELVILLVVLVMLFGATKLPTAARSIGQSIRIFKAETKEKTFSVRDGGAEIFGDGLAHVGEGRAGENGACLFCGGRRRGGGTYSREWSVVGLTGRGRSRGRR